VEEAVLGRQLSRERDQLAGRTQPRARAGGARHRINAGVQQTYYIRGSADQSHSVTPTAADFASLKQNTSAREVSSVNSSAIYGTHSHGVTVSCA